MPDYSKGKIYKITSPNCDEIYIGYTTADKLNHIFNSYKSDCNTNNLGPKIIIDSGDAIIELVELFPCESKNELSRRAGDIIKATLNCCNKHIAGRTHKEYCADNKEKRCNYYKQWRIDNKDKVIDYNLNNSQIMKDYQIEYRLKQNKN